MSSWDKLNVKIAFSIANNIEICKDIKRFSFDDYFKFPSLDKIG